MADSHIASEPSISQTYALFERAARAIKKAKKLKKVVKKAKPARRVKVKKSSKRTKAPADKSWLTKPIKIRQVGNTKRTASAMRRVSVPTLKAPFRGSKVKMRAVGGSFEGIDLIPVISSNLASYGYDEDQSVLLIQFLDGSIYRYDDVPRDVWTRFQTASSKGKFTWSDIRDRYAYEKVQ